MALTLSDTVSSELIFLEHSSSHFSGEGLTNLFILHDHFFERQNQYSFSTYLLECLYLIPDYIFLDYRVQGAPSILGKRHDCRASHGWQYLDCLRYCG